MTLRDRTWRRSPEIISGPGRAALLIAAILFLVLPESASSEANHDGETSLCSMKTPQLHPNLDPSDRVSPWNLLGESKVLRVAIMPLNVGRRLSDLGKIHNWSVRIARVGDGPVKGARIDFVGGMPAHDHGFPTVPRITKELGNGTYLLEGVRFNMAGWWQFVFCIETKHGNDVVRFDILVEP